MWEVWLDLEEEMKERTPFDPVLELLASSQASKLLSPVPSSVCRITLHLPTIQRILTR